MGYFKFRPLRWPKGCSRAGVHIDERNRHASLEIVSEDKPERDLVDKRGDYAEARVPEYWIVNPRSESVTVLRLCDEAYEEAGTFRRGDSATSTLRPEFSVAVSEVFDSARVH